MGKGEDTRQAILDEATSIASRVGLGGLTIGSLATQTQLSKSGLFAHFRSKESLQIQVLEHATARFLDVVVFPTLAVPRGEPRVRELFERWLVWARTYPGGCPFIAAGSELDDQPGPVREQLVRSQRDWWETIIRVVETAVSEGHFRADLDVEQLAYDLKGVFLAYHDASRLLDDRNAERRARHALEALVNAARVGPDPAART